jgi:hypothetical protein
MALARRDQFESIRRTTVLMAHAPRLLAPAPVSAAPEIEDPAATRFVGGLIVAALVGTLLFFRVPLIAALVGAFGG